MGCEGEQWRLQNWARWIHFPLQSAQHQRLCYSSRKMDWQTASRIWPVSSAQGCQQGKGTGNLGEKAANGRFLSMHSLFRSRLGNSGIQCKPSVFPAEAMKQQGYSNTSDSSWSLGERLILTDGYIPSFLVSFVPAAREKKKSFGKNKQTKASPGGWNLGHCAVKWWEQGDRGKTLKTPVTA